MKQHQTNTFISRAAAMLLTVIMAFAGAQTAGADTGNPSDGVDYVDADGVVKNTATDGIDGNDTPTVITEGGNSNTSTTTLSPGWYVVTGSNVEFKGSLECPGAMHLILADGAKMAINSAYSHGMDIRNGGLTIYGQSAGTGELSVTASNGNGIYVYGGDIVINGGKVSAITIYANAIGITNTGNDIIINDGTVTAVGTLHGIDGKKAVTINGGKVSATYTDVSSGGYGIHTVSGQTITLGFRHEDDQIYVDKYGWTKAIVKVKDGQTLRDNDNASNRYSGTISDFSTINGKTLTPVRTVAYIDGDGVTQHVEDFTVLTGSSENTALPAGWYVVSGSDVNYSGNLQCASGDLHIILADGAKLTVGNRLTSTGNLTIYGQSGGTGQLVVTAPAGYNPIQTQGGLTINGGHISASTTYEQHAIQAGANGVTINGGTVSATTTSSNCFGIVTEGAITLGWRTASDRITATSYYAMGGVSVKAGQAFMNSDAAPAYLSGTISDMALIDGKTLRPINPADFAETATDEYTIKTAAGWGVFCDLLSDYAKGIFSGKTVKLADDITVTRMAGAANHDFTGTFDGQEHTLTFNYSTTENDAAPFRYVEDGCVIENLRVCGTIQTSAKYAAGLVAHQYGNVVIRNCRSSVTIESSISSDNGDGTHGGFVAENCKDGDITFEGCLFDGKLLTTGSTATTRCGGFVGWRSNNEGAVIKVKNSLYAPAALEVGETWVSTTESATFVRDGIASDITNSYYTEALGTEQGTKAIAVNKGYSEQVTPDYSTSGIKMRDGYMECDGVLYAPAGASVTVGYVDETGTTTTHSATVLGGGSGDTTLPGGWYVAGRNVSYSGGFLDFNAETYLILADNANLNLTNKGSAINSYIALTIYAQANGTGSLTAESSSDGRGIYVKDLTVNGGNITAKSSYHECIGVGGTVTVNGGNVNATGFRGISAYYVTLNGGTVNANGTYKGITAWTITTLAGATVTASSFASGLDYGPVTVADGLVYTDGNGHYYGGTLSADDKAAIAGQTISPVATTYSVSIADGIANGSVTVARSYAAAGENVILTVTPNTYYTVESVSYNDGSDHTITPVGDVYAFVMPAIAVTVSATFSASTSFDTATDVSYIDASGMEQTAPTVNLLTSASTELLAGWYMAASDVTISDNVAFSSDIHLILKDGVTLTINGELSTPDIDVDDNGNFVGSDLTIYRQSAGTGRLTTSGIMAKTVTVNGGVVTSTVGENYSSIYGNDIVINGGVVTSAAGENGTGICGNDIVIDGGQVTAEATGDYGNGILAFNTIMLGYSRADDFVQATSFLAGGATITIKDGQTLTDGTTTYTDEIPSATLQALKDVTLRPFTTLTLADDADNSSTISGWNGGVADVTLSGRKLTKNGKWNTLCLPFSLNEEQIAASPLAGATIKELDNTASGTSLNNEGTLTLKFNTADEIVAGTPYIIKWTTTGSSIEDPEFTGVIISSTEPTPVVSNDSKVTFVGQYSPFAIDETNINSVIMLSSGNRLGYSNATRTLRPFRAHFEVPGENPVRNFVLDFGEETTGVVSIDHSPLTIDHSADAWYSLDGRKLDNVPTKKGLYIHGGRKVVIK